MAAVSTEISGEQVCPSCGLVAASVHSPTDPYGASSPACWEAFGHLHLVGSSQIAVDTYMSQHPALATPSGRRSVLTHLVGLHMALHNGESPTRIRQVLARVFPDKQLPPPEIPDVPNLRGLNVVDLQGAAPQARAALEIDWAGSVWDAWSAEHARVIELAKLASDRLR